MSIVSTESIISSTHLAYYHSKKKEIFETNYRPKNVETTKIVFGSGLQTNISDFYGQNICSVLNI